MRFMLTRAFAYEGGAKYLTAGSTIADSQANAQPGDYVLTWLTSGTIGGGFVPLDGAASTAKAASAFANEIISATITGADSIGVQR